MRALITITILALSLSQAMAQTFQGYPCTVDCSGHEAGYEWAQDKGINDPSDCGGNSNSFSEGCQAWAEEQEAEEENQFEDEQEEAPDDSLQFDPW